jgi:hypothetical protein
VLPAGAKAAFLTGTRGEQPLPLPPKHPRKVLFLGDTGCRVTSKEVQACNDPQAWPFAQVAAQAAAWKPDLVVHLGDYYYRETACPEDDPGCAGTPHGDNATSWESELFAPAQPLLQAAPWVFVRGNHESCSRGGQGWFRYLEPTGAKVCDDYTAPYWLQAGPVQLVVMDSVKADDAQAPPEQVARYRDQFEEIGRMPLSSAWLVTHKPIWVPVRESRTNQLDSPLFFFNRTLQKASGNRLPDGIDAVLAGHLHWFQAMGFDHGRAAQFVVGNGGSLRYHPPLDDPTGVDVLGARIVSGVARGFFGFFAMTEESRGRWSGVAYDVSGKEIARCLLKGKELSCSKTASKPE